MPCLEKKVANYQGLWVYFWLRVEGNSGAFLGERFYAVTLNQISMKMTKKIHFHRKSAYRKNNNKITANLLQYDTICAHVHCKRGLTEKSSLYIKTEIYYNWQPSFFSSRCKYDAPPPHHDSVTF